MEILIHKESWDKIINYAKAAYVTEKAEIGGMAVVTQDKDGDWTIENPVILPQEIAGTTCDLDKEELATYYTQMAMKYKDQKFRFCWWHSHHTMNAFWSGTDLSSIDEYGEGESDVSFALVVNLKEEYKCRISVWKPVEIHQDVEVKILDDTPEIEIPLDIVTEVKAKCRKRTYVSSYKSGGSVLESPNKKQLVIGQNGFESSYNWAKYSWLDDDLEKIVTPQEQTNFEAKWEYATNKITEFIRQFNTGAWNMHKYKSAVTHTNKILEPYGIQIETLNKRELTEFIEMDSEPYELLTADDKYHDIAESLIDCASYNQSYGGYGI
ncbi:MAG: hypothetical protein Unbinned1966contig1000_21 [Prokaryotic dsDNA virus sp.]|nr:MAG: hypothetical protein Unbinned1966contig1000_21 [Prokaryotic dsDNA virus sp.]|tara:strand:- start:21907 stop:22878 length:972 start_codon:yes stop_codon:yes gene_type:complete